MLRYLTAVLLAFSAYCPATGAENIFGASGFYALSSSFYSLDVGSGFSARDRTARSQGVGLGVFYDSRFSVYSGLRINLAVYPSWATRDRILDSLVHGDILNEMMLECDVLAKKYLSFNPARGRDLWLGYGPALQYMVSRDKGVDLHKYALSLMLALGAHYTLHGGYYVMPELYLGSNIFLKNEQFEKQVTDITNTTDFFRNGFTVSLCVGLGYNKIFYTRNRP
jgi:hypothetical protein